MRSRRRAAPAALALALALAACTITDPTRPIALLAEELDELDRANLEEAARCWNLQFGTQLVWGEAAAGAEQHVEAFYSLHTCLRAAAEVQAGFPHALAICPRKEALGTSDLMFRILSHELGHVLNIVGHPRDDHAVMGRSGKLLRQMFRRADFDMFAAANPGFVAAPSCPRVVRLARPDAPSIDHCVCDEGAEPAPEDRAARGLLRR